MSFCDLCKAIPWEALPTIPPDIRQSFSGTPFIDKFYGWPETSSRFAHHQSLGALRDSAIDLGCSLCRLIFKQVESCRLNLEDLQPQWEAGTAPWYDWPLWEFWIVKRREGGDGIWVMSFTENDQLREFALVAAIGLCVRDDDPLGLVIRGRPVEKQGGTSTEIARIRKWLKECDEHHTCSLGEALLPSRVIDVGDSIDSPHVKLRETGGCESGKYISLSYCWGKGPGFTTTKSTLADRKHRIMISNLPQTHQDAIRLTRELGVRYLWIDSICICQDDQENWERESAEMLSVYSNAYLTIGASRSKDSSEGIFGERPTREYAEFEYTSGELHGQVLAFNLSLREEAFSHMYINQLYEPISDRAWTLQERALSRRALLYGTQQMFFECNEGFQGDDGLFLESRFVSIYGEMEKEPEALAKSECVAKTNDERFSSYQAALRREWYHLLYLYGSRKLTKASDKLPAISGLARIFEKRLNDEYVVGLWKSHLIEGLLWQGLGYRGVQEYRSPSWSWASMDGKPAFDGRGYNTLGEVLKVKVNMKGANPFGEVIDAAIQIRAPMERLYLALEDWNPTKSNERNLKVRTANGYSEGCRTRFDFDFTVEDAQQEAQRIVKSLNGVEIFALILAKRVKSSVFGETYGCLIVRRVEGCMEYQRLGYIQLHEKLLSRRPEDQIEGENPTITLV